MQSFIQGLLFGLGFSISLFGLGLILITAISSLDVPTEEAADLIAEKVQDALPAESLDVIAHEKMQRGKDVVVLGTVKNEGDSVRSSYTLEVELFDEMGKFVDECRESYFSRIEPGEEKHFKVTCHGRAAAVPRHARYEVHVTD